MTWNLYRWVWRLEAPIHVGLLPSGSLDRCRPYVPDRNLWAALSAEIARQRMGEAPENLDLYKKIGKEIGCDCRFSYLYPSEQFDGKWRAWLPFFEKGKGLCWKKEISTEPIILDRTFRGRLLDARTSTAIDPGTDSAAEGLLHDTEVVNTSWRASDEGKTGPVAMTGYLFCKDQSIYRDLSRVVQIHVGGDIRYGLGKMVRVEIEKTDKFFGYDTQLNQENPQVYSRAILCHKKACSESDSIYGSLECLVGWDAGIPKHMFDTEFWVPGSRHANEVWDEVPKQIISLS